jgi:hypothetical protein
MKSVYSARLRCAYSDTLQVGERTGMAAPRGAEGVHTVSALRMLAAEVAQAADTLSDVAGVRGRARMIGVAAAVGMLACSWYVLAVGACIV